MSTSLETIYAISAGLARRFSDGNSPFEIMTRLLEECGELAREVNHFEGRGVKHEKHGSPDPDHLAKEIQDVLRCAAQLAQHYGVEANLDKSIADSYQRLVSEGWIKPKNA